jgi:ABC-type polysaccharide/polyol phosphate export permease
MFQREMRKSTLQSAVATAEVIFHAAVRNVRKSHGNAVVGLLMNIMQTVLLVAVFYLMFELLGMRGTVIRGDYLLYIMSGIFVFMTHVKTVGAVVNCEGHASPMMKHSPMNTFVAVAAAALGALYQQFLSAVVVLYVYHAAWTPLTFEDPLGIMAMFVLAWFLGVALGMVFQAAKPWWPEGVGLISQIYMRANMILSGKMFVANMMPGYILAFFDWNPLFHIIDQGRGFIFLNYSPHYSNWAYPIWCTLAFLMIGLMAEFYTRKHASASWGAGK